VEEARGDPDASSWAAREWAAALLVRMAGRRPNEEDDMDRAPEEARL
jgi:hypothetical protein